MIFKQHRLPPQGNPGVRPLRRASILVVLLGAAVYALTGCTHPDAVDSRAVARRKQAMDATPNPSKDVISGADLEQMQQRTMGGHRY